MKLSPSTGENVTEAVKMSQTGQEQLSDGYRGSTLMGHGREGVQQAARRYGHTAATRRTMAPGRAT